MSWLPADLPLRADVAGLTFVPLSPALVEADYAAVMRDVTALRAWSGQDWPTTDFSIDDNLVDLVRHDREQRERVALTYSVMHDDTVVGCIYVRPIGAALETRSIEVDLGTLAPDDVVVRGWAHDHDAVTLISATRLFLGAAPFDFATLWWQTNTDCPAQLAACDELGLARRMNFGGPKTTWVLAAA